MVGEAALSGKYTAYPEYKESGVEWLGEVPIDWDIKKLKYICKVQTGTKNTENAIEEGVYPFFVRSQTVERINSFGADCEAVLTAGDGVGVGRVFHYIEGKFDYHQRVYMLNNFGAVLGRFVYYYLSNNFYKVALEGNAKSTVDSLRLPQFLNFEFSLPKIEVQNTIIDFLDHEIAKIDTLIDKQQQLITLLKEKRQAVISHAVTKGLKSNAPMRDSGVEWLGEVPAHWTLSKIKYVAELTPKKSQVENAKSSKCSFVPMEKLKTDQLILDEIRTVGDVIEGYTYFENEDVLMAKVTPCFENKNMVVARGLENGIGFGSSEIYVLRANSKILNDFLYYRLQEDVFMGIATASMSGAGGLKRVPSDIINNFIFSIPPKQEQGDIFQHICAYTSKFDDLIEKAVSVIALMQERRTALISAAVTGKIDVRNWVAPAASNNHKEVAP
jgi:type I restriction enzyme S subunit